MKRTKRFTLRRVALGLAVAAVIAPAAQAEPIGSYERQSQVEIPYLSHGAGVSHMDFDQASQASGKTSAEIPYLSHGNLVSSTDFWNYDPATGERIANTSPGISADQLAGLYSGAETSIAPDDMALSRPSNVGSPSVTATDTGWDVGSTTMSVFALGFVLLAGASLLVIRHNRRTRLSPA